MKKHLRYLKYVLRHKWFVFLYCLEYGLIWRGIKHDWSKFLPSEWFPYVEYFYGGKKEIVPNVKVFTEDGKLIPKTKTPDDVQLAFDLAWNHHQKRNSHHWQYWLLHPDKPRPTFVAQSFDGGMSHVYLYDLTTGKKAATFCEGSDCLSQTPEERRLRSVLDLEPVTMPMPDSDRKEMLADWRGAGRALGKPNTWEWYKANKNNIALHPETRQWVEDELAKLKD